MKTTTKILALLTALMMVLGMVPAAFADTIIVSVVPASTTEAVEEAAVEAPAEAADVIDTAYLMYANSDWSAQYWGGDADGGVVAKNADITGEGSYTIGLDFTGTEAGAAAGLAFSAVGIINGEKTLPNYYIRINEIRVNGTAIDAAKGYTSSDDGVTTRMNIYNEWVAEVPADARSFDGNTADASPIIVDPAAFESVTTVEVDFDLMKNAEDVAYIAFADSAWGVQYWGGVAVTSAKITGAGDYTVGLDFTATENGAANGVAFTALYIQNGEKTFPGYFLKINEIRIDGQAVEFGKGYTSSDDGVTTRMNIYNEWVASVPADARSFDGVTEDAAACIVAKELFTEAVKSYEIDFTLVPVTDEAYIMFASSDWGVQYWGGEADGGVVATNAQIEGAGTYTIGLDFTGTEAGAASGVAFTSVGVVTGEKTFPGYFIDVTEIKINGEAIELGKGYTSSDDQICTRENLYNEWVSDLPTDARRADGDLEGASPMMVKTEDFAEVKTMEVTFNYIFGVPAATEEATLSADEAAELLAKDYNAYIGVQSKNYIFRNMWNDNYGRDDAEHEGYFQRLTGWDGDLAVDYGGTFEDAVITTDGTYTVSLTTGDMGFGGDESFNLLFVSTDIPSSLVKGGFLTIDNVTVKIGDAKTQEYTEITTGDDYVRITLLDTYNQAAEPFGYNVPGANTPIVVTFTVTGLTD